MEVPIQPMPDVGNIVENSRVIRNGHVFAPVVRRDVSDGMRNDEHVEPKKATVRLVGLN